MRVLITGGASGIGRAVAKLILQRTSNQARLLLVDQDAKQLEQTAAELGPGIAAAVADLADPDGIETVVAQAERELGGLDGVVSNAGLIRPGALNALSIADYERVFAVNARAAWLLGKHAYPMLKASKGAIVATASIASENPSPTLGTYSASKAALVMLIRQMSVEWGPDGIRCNCVSPGAVATAMTGDYQDEQVRRRRSAGTALGRVGEAEDIAAAIVFLLGPDSSYISGINLVVDGGGGGLLMPLLNGGGGYGLRTPGG